MILTVEGNDNRIHFWGMIKCEAVNKLQMLIKVKKQAFLIIKKVIFYSDVK